VVTQTGTTNQTWSDSGGDSETVSTPNWSSGSNGTQGSSGADSLSFSTTEATTDLTAGSSTYSGYEAGVMTFGR